MKTLWILAAVAASLAAAPQQQPPATARPAFEAATIKLAAPTNAAPVPIAPTAPNRLRIPSRTLVQMIYMAYGGAGFNTSMSVRGGPDWVRTTTFYVEGVASERATAADLRLMLQTLLEDRFALKIRDATAEQPMGDILTLVLDTSDGTLGPKVRKWDGTCRTVMAQLMYPAAQRPLQKVGDTFVVGPASDADDPGMTYCPSGFRRGGLIIDGATMSTVAEFLSLPPGRQVLGKSTQDRTGLTGRYTLDLDYLFGATDAQLAESANPSLSTAIREQWGMRLVPGKGQLKVIVVESAQLPTTD
jgi:uncharacterized protein (TIGR03435 family)